MNKEKVKWHKRKIRHFRVRKKVVGSPERPRLSIYRSLNNMYCQLVNDVEGKTITALSTLTPDIKKSIKSGSNITAAKVVGKRLAEESLKKGIQKVVLDRGAFPYHGRIKALAEAAREAGLKF